MANTIQVKRTTTAGNAPTALEPGEPAALLDVPGTCPLYMGDSAGDAVLINPPPAPMTESVLFYKFASNAAVADPGNGYIKLNGTAISGGTTTKMMMARVADNGVDVDVVWRNTNAAQLLCIWDSTHPKGNAVYVYTLALPVNHGGWWECDITVVDQRGDIIADGAACQEFRVGGTAIYLQQWPAAAQPEQNIQSAAANKVPLYIYGWPGQTSNLLEFRDTNGTTVLSYVDKDGVFHSA